MATASKPRKRTRGEIETLPSGSLRVRVYAGIDPVSKKKHYLTEVVPAGPKAAKEAEKVRTRLLNEVDEKRSPRTRDGQPARGPVHGGPGCRADHAAHLRGVHP